MTDDSYGICRSCRFCHHSSEAPMCCGSPQEEDWLCVISGDGVLPDSGCERFRPGFCGVCADFKDGICRLTGSEADEIGVCTRFDPCAPRR